MTPPNRIADMSLEDRPRERLAERGAAALRNAELIAILLRTGVRGASAVAVAESLLARFGNLESLARASLDDLRIRGVGRDEAIALKAAFTLATRMAEELRRESPVLDTPEAIAALLRDEAAGWQVERLQVIMLNTRRRLIRMDPWPRESSTKCRSTPARCSAAPSPQMPTPSLSPTITPAAIPCLRTRMSASRATSSAGHLLKIELLDHIILGRRTAERPRDYISLRELGHFHS